ncbi:NAD(P)/FAD-dependent oxidoreductase [[Clostridium] hylemonae]|uniref:NAD(P)/FAD-dependent oxidoreductase n=1 Tax=[Clostridium] hylemonae TaxID=89153 RepID=UPI001106B890|nr:NAD(P)/FAD-dependent oxidoreductase [[Clostridium] hylemonae]
MSKVLIAGGGAAGMCAAAAAAENGHEVHIYEKNDRLGKKLFITGKGRCNITNACDMEGLFDAVVSNSKFLYSSFYSFTNEDVISFFERIGVKTKVERGDRVFPASDHSSDVIRGLEREMERLGVHIHLSTAVRQIKAADGRFEKIVTDGGREVPGDVCIVATGGLSYQATGSTGDGLRFAENLGHTVTECMPSLVPMECKEEWVKELQGLSLRNVRAAVYDGRKKLYEDFGEMLFTHYGVSGPLMLTASSYVGKKLKQKELQLLIDLKPALSEEQLDQRVLRDFEENRNRQFKNAVGRLFPAKLVPVMIKLSSIDAEKKVNTITKEERRQFAGLIKHLPVTLTGLRDYREAIITRGGVSVKEVDPGTMESKLVKGICFCGEVLDLDALTGGFNLQIAWSTGHAAGAGIV